MHARSWGPISPRRAPGSRKPQLIPWDKALSARGFQAVAELVGLAGRGERPDHGAVDGLAVRFALADHRLTRAQLIGVLALQGLERLLGIGLVALRRHLNHVAGSAGRGG